MEKPNKAAVREKSGEAVNTEWALLLNKGMNEKLED